MKVSDPSAGVRAARSDGSVRAATIMDMSPGCSAFVGEQRFAPFLVMRCSADSYRCLAARIRVNFWPADGALHRHRRHVMQETIYDTFVAAPWTICSAGWCDALFWSGRWRQGRRTARGADRQARRPRAAPRNRNCVNSAFRHLRCRLRDCRDVDVAIQELSGVIDYQWRIHHRIPGGTACKRAGRLHHRWHSMSNTTGNS